jgi:hypothetical protein
MESSVELSKQSVKLSMALGIGWVADHLQEFSVGGTSAASFSKADIARLKPISELALAVSLLNRCGLDLPILDELADWIWEECEEGRKITRLLLARPDFLPCCALYASMYQMGRRSSSLHPVIELLAKSDMAKVLPLQPWSRLALEYNLCKLDLFPPNALRTDDLYVLTRPEPWVMSGEIAYAVTHELLYLTDFGFRPLGSEDLELYLASWIPYWAKVFIEERDDDVTGEFAMVASCVGDHGNFGAAALATVIAHADHDGSVCGPKGAGAVLFSEGDTEARRDFLARYHTTLVMVMSAAMTLLRGRLA